MFNKDLGLVRIGTIDAGYTIPLKYVEIGGYKAFCKRRQDLTAERNADGEMIREVASNKPSTFTLVFLPLPEHSIREVLDEIHARYLVEAKRELQVTFYDTEHGVYTTEIMYIPDFEMPLDYIGKDGEAYFDTITLEFIGN